jgi:hypothetical protein
MRSFITNIVLICSFSTVAINAVYAACLSESDNQKLAVLEAKLADAIAKQPDCQAMYGAAACISPREQAILDYLRVKKQYSDLAQKRDEAIQTSPSCVDGRGAAACLSARDEAIFERLAAKVPECAGAKE